MSDPIFEQLIFDRDAARAEAERLRNAIIEHHKQKADDRCWLDDSTLYAAAGLAPHDDRVGDKAAMLENCKRFIDRRCEGGHWPSYADLKQRVAELERVAKGLVEAIKDSYQWIGSRCPGLGQPMREKIRTALADAAAVLGDQVEGRGK